MLGELVSALDNSVYLMCVFDFYLYFHPSTTIEEMPLHEHAGNALHVMHQRHLHWMAVRDEPCLLNCMEPLFCDLVRLRLSIYHHPAKPHLGPLLRRNILYLRGENPYWTGNPPAVCHTIQIFCWGKETLANMYPAHPVDDIARG